jgi:hypothetical protein
LTIGLFYLIDANDGHYLTGRLKGMSKHLSTLETEQYRRQAMSPAQLLIIDTHIATCRACREKLDDIPRPGTVFTSLQSAFDPYTGPENQHLSFEQIAAYVDDELDESDRESLEHHLLLCQMCEAEARDLRLFSQVMDHPAEQYLPSLPPTGQKKPFIFWRSGAARVAAAAALILAISTSVLISRRQITTLQSLVSELQQTREKLEANVTELKEENQSIRRDYEANKAALSDLQAQLNRYQPDAHATESEEHGATILTLNDGGLQITLDAKGNLLGLESLPRTWQQEVRAALLNEDVKAPRWLSELKGKPITLLNGSGVSVAFDLIGPIGKVVETNRPTFRWHPLEGASGYAVAVFDSKFNKVAESGLIQALEWVPPQALRRGTVYSWQVTALKDGKEIMSPHPPASEAKFRVLEQAIATELERAREQHAGSNLILGVLHAQAGLLDQAERDFQTLADQNPRSFVAKKLLRSVRSLRRR